MRNKKLSELIVRLENYLECWKQFNHYMNLARFKKFTLDDENQFLEVKSIITQELELILSSIESGPVTREEVHGLIGAAPSIRYLSENNEGGLREVENKWHKQFITLQSILGQLKVKQKQLEHQSLWQSLFGKKA
jgi:CHAD domain-containing protein